MERNSGIFRISSLIALSVIITGTSIYLLYGQQPDAQQASPEVTFTNPALTSDVSLWQTPEQDIEDNSLPAEAITSAKLSLRGTTPDGELVLNAAGLPIITPSMRRLFEYYLATLGEQPVSAIRDQFYNYVKEQYSPRVAVASLAYFDRYVSYKVHLAEQQLELAEMFSALSITELLQQRMELLSRTRTAELGPEMAEAFFGEEERYDRFILSKTTIERDQSLTEEQRQQKLNELARAWPEYAEQQSLSVQQKVLKEQVTKARANGASDTDIYELRSVAFGYEAAERLSALDNQRDQWQQRLNEYSQQKQILLAAGLGSQDTSLDELRTSHFSGSEIKLVQALEKLQRL
ncbi:lipase secretion chaperone [Parendozoicomonas sp. Alg238-R29]|uniref:lipase secretion chaperone n=1 Tax=Parendozoicomonas sp. Alg238-R29 TaxID=2993446 RepID=UPI00248E9C4A|nr:lipase secretion chaperone [Parendozoicomonas sp. Alg238-R29]